jgi:exodeoxyribonuclease VII small subunit
LAGLARGANYNDRFGVFKPSAMPVEELTLSPEPASYEQALAELEQLVHAMEAGRLPLDQLMDGHRRAAALLAFCRSRLQALEAQVHMLEPVPSAMPWGSSTPWSAA